MSRRRLTDAFRAAERRFLTEAFMCLPARVESYDHTEQRASVVPLLKRVDPETGEAEARSVIPSVPVIWPRAGGASLTFPLNQGDTVALVFADRSMDKWKAEGGEVAPDDSRAHAYADAIALPGLAPFADAVGPPNNDDVRLELGDSVIILKGDGDIELHPKSSTVKVFGSLEATEEVIDKDGKLSTLRDTYNEHTHAQLPDTNGDGQEDTEVPNEAV